MTTRDLASLLYQSRVAKGLTRAQLARRIGVCVERLTRWEAGGDVPGWGALQSLVHILDLDPGEAFLARVAAIDGRKAADAASTAWASW